MLVGRPTVYTGWDPESARLSEQLIPFPDWGDVITVVSRPEGLVEAVEASAHRRETDDQRARRQAIVSEYLGPSDGLASQRTLGCIRASIDSFDTRTDPGARQRRDALRARRRPLRLRRRTRRAVSRLRRAAGSALGR
jgi:hypothetical protein